MEMSHSAGGARGAGAREGGNACCAAVVAGGDRYCARTATLQAFAEANRCKPCTLHV